MAPGGKGLVEHAHDFSSWAVKHGDLRFARIGNGKPYGSAVY